MSLYIHYNFNDNDTSNQATSGSGFNALGQNGVTFGPGIGGNAVQIDGASGQHVILPTVDFSSIPSWSISLWVNESSITSQDEAYITFGTVGSEVTIFHDTSWPAGGNQIGFATTGQSNYMTNPFANPGDLNTWKHYALTYDGSVRSAYVDGVLVGSDSMTVGSIASGGFLGKHTWSGGSSSSTRFVGAIDEVQIYTTSLDSTQINQLYTNPTTVVPEPSLLGFAFGALALGFVLKRKFFNRK